MISVLWCDRFITLKMILGTRKSNGGLHFLRSRDDG
jgi:hypothetical protein